MLSQWLAGRHWSHSPLWFQRWQHRYRLAYLGRTLAPKLAAAQAAGIGIRWHTVPADADRTVVLQQIADMISAAPRAIVPSLDHLKIVVTSESDRSAAIAVWQGHRRAWFWDGYDAIAARLPMTHKGLTIGVNAIGEALGAVVNE